YVGAKSEITCWLSWNGSHRCLVVVPALLTLVSRRLVKKLTQLATAVFYQWTVANRWPTPRSRPCVRWVVSDRSILDFPWTYKLCALNMGRPPVKSLFFKATTAGEETNLSQALFR
ncbi:hypothetical protein AHF37_12773, partial [Paragonimus kellicotti]